MKVSLVLGHLPGLGRVSISISQKFHFKNGKIYRFTVKITVNYGQMGIFDDLAIARKKALQTPLFFAMLRETHLITIPGLSCNMLKFIVYDNGDDDV